MNEENNNENSSLPKENNNELISEKFFSEINSLKKLNDKKDKIDLLNNYLKENSVQKVEYFSKLYDFLILNLNENNNNYVSCQLNLIETLINNNSNNLNENLKNFAKKVLPKLFDKYYLQNQKINEKITNILKKILDNKILNITDYYPHIENISLEEEDNYKNNIISLLLESIEKNENIKKNEIPKGIIDLLNKFSNDNDNNLSEIAKKALDILNKRETNDNINNSQNNKNIEEINKDENNAEKKDIVKKSEDDIVNKDEIKEEKPENNSKNNEIIQRVEENSSKGNEIMESNGNKNYNENLETKNENDENGIQNKILEKEIIKENENKENEKIEKKELIEESKQNNNQETIKEGGLKRSAIQGKLNKFRKQFGKNKKSKEIETSLNEKISEKINEKISNEINNEENNNEIKRTNTIEEMFKNKMEEGFDTETNNILDLGKNNNNNDINVLNEIEGKLGINFNKIINEENKKNIDESDKNEKIEIDLNKEKDFIQKNNAIQFNDESSSIENQTKKYINPDDRPIHPYSKNLNFDFNNYDDEPDKKLLKKENINDNNSKDKKSPKSLKSIIIGKDLEELGKMSLNEKTISSKNKSENEISSSNNSNKTDKKFLSNEIEFKNDNDNTNKKINPFIIDDNNIKEKETEIKNIENTLNDINKNINKTLDNLNNMNIIKKESCEERRPKLKIDDFQKKLELALEQEQIEGEKESQEEEKENENEKENKNKYKEDPRFDNIKAILGNQIVENLFSNKWELKKEGYEKINNYIQSNDLEISNANDLFEYLRFKLKNFKETNFNVNREAINVFITLVKKKLIIKENLLSVILGYHEKITDQKLKDNFLELLNSCLDIIEPNLLLKHLLAQISKKNNAKLYIEYSLYLGKIVENYNAKKELPYKELTEFCKIMANNSNPQCRNASINLICILYRYYGDEVRKLIKDIKESTLKNIENEISKITVIERRNSIGSKQKSSNKKRPSETIEIKSNLNGGDKGLNGGSTKNEEKQNVIIDISKKITPEILKNIKDGKWTEKKEACDKIEKILKEANMKILPNGLNELMNLIKQKLSDSNKNIVKMIINLLNLLIEALKHNFKQWSKNIALNLIPNLSDKNQIFRNEIQICFDKWVQYVGFETLIIHFPPFLKNENVDMRNEILDFIKKNENKFNKEIGNLVFKEMENNLLLCLQDKNINIKNKSEDMIKFSIQYVSLNNYYEKIKLYKPAISNDLKLILDKIQNDINGDNMNKNDIDTNKKKEDDEYDIDNEGNININEIMNSNSKSNSKNGNGGSDIIPQKNKHKRENSGFLKSNSSILGRSSITNSERESINSSNGNMKYKKIINKNKSKNIKINNSINFLNKSKTINNKEQEVIKTAKSKDLSTSRKYPLTNYKTMSNFNKNKKLDTSILNKSVQKETTYIKSKIIKKEERRDSILSQNLNKSSVFKDKKENSGKKGSALDALKSLSNSLILKKNNDKKNKKDEIFCSNIKVIPNKAKRLENDLKYKFSLDYISKDSTIKSKIKEFCKNLFTEDFNKKILSDDFKKQVTALKEMKEQIDKNTNIIIYLDNLDIILKAIGIKLNGNLNPTSVKNLIEFFDSLYNIITTKGHPLNEIELNIIISLLIDKLSINNNILKEHLMKLLYEFIELSNDINKLVLYILNNTLGKNNKIKTEILDITYELYNKKKFNIATKNYVKILGKYICINDNIVKSKVLNLFKEIFIEMGDELFILLDFLTDKDKSFLASNLIQENDDSNSEEEIEIEKQPRSLNSSDDENGDSDTKKNSKKEQILNGKINSEKELVNILNKLLIKNETEQLNAIILLHEIVYQHYEENRKILIENIDKIIQMFIKIMHEMFIENNINQMNIKFARYLITVLLKISSNKELISNISNKILSEITNDLLNYLLIQGFDKLKEKQEGSIIFKSINSTMLRILENCDKNDIISVLLDIIKKYQKNGDKKMCNLSVKCLLKTTENLSEIINNLDMKKIFNEMHFILYNFFQLNPEIKNKNQTDDVILRFIKNFINNVVKIKKNKILDIYNDSIKKSEKEDKYIIYWIQNYLEHINKYDKNFSLDSNNVNNIEKSIEIESDIKNVEITNKEDIYNKNINEKDENKIEELKKKWNNIKSK